MGNILFVSQINNFCGQLYESEYFLVLSNDPDFERTCCVVVITPPLSRNGGTARTAIQVHGVNLNEIRLIRELICRNL